MLAVRIYSEILEEEIVFQIDAEIKIRYKKDTIVYFPGEITAMKGMTADQVKAIHMIKKEFSPLKPLKMEIKDISKEKVLF